MTYYYQLYHEYPALHCQQQAQKERIATQQGDPSLIYGEITFQAVETILTFVSCFSISSLQQDKGSWLCQWADELIPMLAT